MGKFISTLIFVCVLNLLAPGQNATQQCPTITVSGPAGISRTGEQFNVSAIVTPAMQDLKYSWYTSAGTIVKGQGTPAISVLTSSDNDSMEIAVRVEVEGLSNGCPHSATDKFGVSSRTFDYFIEDYQWKMARLDEGVRLDNLAIQLSNGTGQFTAYIILSTERSRRLVDQRVRRMREWLFKKRKFPDKNHYVFLLERSGREAIQYRLLPRRDNICAKNCIQIP